MSFVPADAEIPNRLVTEQFRLEPLGPQHNGADFAARRGFTYTELERDWPFTRPEAAPK
jgi:hypothetical protein